MIIKGKQMQTWYRKVVVVALLVLAFVAVAADKKPDESTPIDKTVIDTIRAALTKTAPGVKLEDSDIQATPMPGIYEISFGANVYYISKDGRYLVNGAIRDMQTGKDLTTPRLQSARVKAVNAMGEDKMIIFSPGKDKFKRTITVFTDVDCPYCRLMHSQLADYYKHGFRVRYLLFPRDAINTPTYNKAVSVWCAKDRNDAMSKAKSGAEIPSASCANPIAEHLNLANAMGVNGTPSIILDNGDIIPGHASAGDLIKYIEKKQVSQK